MGAPEQSPAARCPEPELFPVLAPVWDAYHHLLTWADGWGGLSVEALESYFRAPNPGARLDREAERLVRRLVPWLAREERRLQREEREARERAAGGGSGRRRR